ncbi:AChain Crystal Structure Of Glutathione Transferase Gstfua3 From Phanerochaete Chrysosporium [Lentinula edodes]|uniref:AChain Crystal Structure Of Glutathione Transferase Gstfua3 From Phanerochaete Chrysosporium n=1 Tax=Lentinula edodes TaxID=5353 RepID=A0A1Q3EJA9_LENED|nr:AChain Crystal Structure Of Glutathione Transferase Gstfua3 From Phanerochaete Chrysosporium [Lentinula edodes]
MFLVYLGSPARTVDLLYRQLEDVNYDDYDNDKIYDCTIGVRFGSMQGYHANKPNGQSSKKPRQDVKILAEIDSQTQGFSSLIISTTMAANTIVFYDIPFAESNICWSPNTWKTRYSLNYKGLSYRTEWIEYPDIEALCIKIGAAPTDVKADGITPDYTLPVIYDPSTDKTISDSFAIALYLDTAYPDTPKLFPPGTQALQEAFVHFRKGGVRSIFGGRERHCTM